MHEAGQSLPERRCRLKYPIWCEVCTLADRFCTNSRLAAQSRDIYPYKKRLALRVRWIII